MGDSGNDRWIGAYCTHLLKWNETTSITVYKEILISQHCPFSKTNRRTHRVHWRWSVCWCCTNHHHRWSNSALVTLWDAVHIHYVDIKQTSQNALTLVLWLSVFWDQDLIWKQTFCYVIITSATVCIQTVFLFRSRAFHRRQRARPKYVIFKHLTLISHQSD